jgi:hypothetical protein
MAEVDRTIRWETEALRESAERRRSRPPSPAFRSRRDEPASRGASPLVTLREAHHATGIPIETLRKWARRGHVPSDLRDTEFGLRRLIDLPAVRRRADELGRELPPDPAPPEPGDVAPEADASAPPGTMIVPIAAWDRILMQLGNLHQAGRELADARERAAKAETEALFLRERLAELRNRVDETGGPSYAEAPAEAGWRRLATRFRRRSDAAG